MKKIIAICIAMLLVMVAPMTVFATTVIGEDMTVGTFTAVQGGVINNGTIGTLNATGTGGDVTVTNNNVINTINLSENSTLTNNTSGTVNTVNGDGTCTVNDGAIGVNNSTVVENNGSIGSVSGTTYYVGNKGTVFVNNGMISSNYGGTVNINSTNGTIYSNTNNGSNVAWINTNDGIVKGNNSNIKTNNGTVEDNNGYLGTNKGTVDKNRAGTYIKVTESKDNAGLSHNEGTVEQNNGYIYQNNSTGTVDANNKVIYSNSGTVNDNTITGAINTTTGLVVNNEGKILHNSQVGEGVTTNSGTIEDNKGTVGTNTLIGVITNNITDAEAEAIVNANYGTVKNASVDVDGHLVSGEDTYYGVTYYDGSTEKSNEQAKANTKITIKTATKDGYKLVKWSVTTPTGIQDYYYTVGQEVDVTSPLHLEAVWEVIQQEEKKQSSGGGATFTSTPTSEGSSLAPITSGGWNVANGNWSYTVSGQKLVNCTAWIQYTDANGQTVIGKFYFDKNGNMQTGWQKINDIWYYFDTTTGAMLTSTTTPDGYKVDAEGKYIAQ